MKAPLKIVVTGPVGAGKSTLIRTLAKGGYVDTDARATEDIGKKTTTVAMDHAVIDVEGTPLHVFGTPGQERFDYMWEILAEGALGTLLLVRADRPGDLPKARQIFEFILSQSEIPYVVGVTHTDAEEAWAPEEIALFLRTDPALAVGFDPRDPRDALRPFVRLLGALDGKE